jgi:hypothetical protein
MDAKMPENRPRVNPVVCPPKVVRVTGRTLRERRTAVTPDQGEERSWGVALKR